MTIFAEQSLFLELPSLISRRHDLILLSNSERECRENRYMRRECRCDYLVYYGKLLSLMYNTFCIDWKVETNSGYTIIVQR